MCRNILGPDSLKRAIDSELLLEVRKKPLQLFHAMFDTVCTLPLSADLFAQALHPREPVVSVGLSTGHVQTFRLPSDEVNSDDDDVASNSSSRNGKGHIDTMWRTRRHKGSCRTLGFGIDGETLYSAGTDGLVKAAKAETGVVENKIAIPTEKDGLVSFYQLNLQWILYAILWFNGLANSAVFYIAAPSMLQQSSMPCHPRLFFSLQTRAHCISMTFANPTRLFRRVRNNHIILTTTTSRPSLPYRRRIPVHQASASNGFRPEAQHWP